MSPEIQNLKYLDQGNEKDMLLVQLVLSIFPETRSRIAGLLEESVLEYD
jgi:hypothetical protein